MEKPSKPKSKNILKFFPKTASSVAFQPSYNPTAPAARDKRSSSSDIFSSSNSDKKRFIHHAKGGSFSGPMVPLIPKEARRRSKKATLDAPQEPSSPKISCMGQIKHGKKKLTKKTTTKIDSLEQRSESPPSDYKRKKKLPRSRIIRRLFSGIGTERRSSGGAGARHDEEGQEEVLDERSSSVAPGLGQMTRFASSRNALAGFDWTTAGAQVAPDNDDDLEERPRRGEEERDNDDDEEEETMIDQFSGPIIIGGGVDLQPRKEINLWKRRIRAPPQPLRLQSATTPTTKGRALD